MDLSGFGGKALLHFYPFIICILIGLKLLTFTSDRIDHPGRTRVGKRHSFAFDFILISAMAFTGGNNVNLLVSQMQLVEDKH